MLNNYNLFNNKVDNLTSTFLEMECYLPNTLEKYIVELIKYFRLEMYCSDIVFLDENTDCYGLYSNKQKKLLINYEKIINKLQIISSNNYFIKANIYRIILHEIKHVLQYKMVDNEDFQLYILFQKEFLNKNKTSIGPSEVNAEIESTMIILKNYNKDNYLYNRQFIFSYNLINSFYIPKCITCEFCKKNNLQFLNMNSFDRFIYGFNFELNEYKKILSKK